MARLFEVVGRAADGHVEPDGEHQVFEHLPVLAALDSLGVGANHLDAIFVQSPTTIEGHGGIKGGLAAERRQQHELAVRLDALHLRDFPGDDLIDALGSDGLDVSAVRELGISHDRGRVRVHQDDAIALLLERLAGLGARIIKLARLPDNDRAGADDQDRMNVGALRHKSAGNKLHSTPVVSVKVVGITRGSHGGGVRLDCISIRNFHYCSARISATGCHRVVREGITLPHAGNDAVLGPVIAIPGAGLKRVVQLLPVCFQQGAEMVQRLRVLLALRQVLELIRVLEVIEQEFLSVLPINSVSVLLAAQRAPF